MNAAALLDSCDTIVEFAACVRTIEKQRASLDDDFFTSLAASLLSISLASSSLPTHLLALVARKRLRASTVDKAGQGTGQDGINMPMSDASSGNIIAADTAALAENIPR